MSRKLELLSPAANSAVAFEAIKHGADAVYIGGPAYGARKAASNNLDDIAEVVDFAHKFRSKVYVTVNTIIYEDELGRVCELCHDLYRIGVDALIVQDMALLRMKLPPIALHASTQCDIRTPEKARFLQEVGFSQLVLPRELTVDEIREIAGAVDVPVECFIHGALCVSYSGRCHASFASSGRSANRGECAQICRLPYTLVEGAGNTLVKDRHLLSLKDFNATPHLKDLIEAGVASFKIEGRLKDAGYVKNITSHYDILLNRIINDSEGRFERSSFGSVDRCFTPDVCKSFNRGFTTYFLGGKQPGNIASIRTPKSMGEIIGNISELNNGDGISFFDRNGDYVGVNINRVENGRIITGKDIVIPHGAEIHRTSNLQWNKLMGKETAARRIGVSVRLDGKGVEAHDERGVFVRIPLDVNMSEARKPMDYRDEFAKLGNSIYRLENYESLLGEKVFIPRSEISALRRRLVEALDLANESTYPLDLRRPEDLTALYPQKELDYKDNVSNSMSGEFYRSHGVVDIQPALEAGSGQTKRGTVVMTTRHCVLRELGMCRKKKVSRKIQEPLFLIAGDRRYRIDTDCRSCRMRVLTD